MRFGEDSGTLLAQKRYMLVDSSEPEEIQWRQKRYYSWLQEEEQCQTYWCCSTHSLTL